MTQIFIFISSMLGGGAERVVSELSTGLSDGFRSQIIMIDNTEIKYPINKSPLYLYYKRVKFPSPLNGLYVLINGIFRYYQLLIMFKPSVSLSVLDTANIINPIACLITGTPSIISIHCNPSNIYGTSYITYILRKVGIALANRFSKKIIVVSNGIKDVLVSKFSINPDKIEVIYNPVDLKKIYSLKMEAISELTFFNTSLPILISIGSIIQVKGQWHLIRIFAHVRKIIPCKLVLCGEGIMKNDLIKLVSDYGLENEVFFAGWCDNPYKYLSKSTIFVSSSLSEALPTVHIEAMACGCPVISTDCKYGPREILEDGKYGILTKELDGINYDYSTPLIEAETDMMEKILLLLSDDKLRNKYAMLGLQRAELFDKKIAIEKYSKVILEVVNS